MRQQRERETTKEILVKKKTIVRRDTCKMRENKEGGNSESQKEQRQEKEKMMANKHREKEREYENRITSNDSLAIVSQIKIKFYNSPSS